MDQRAYLPQSLYCDYCEPCYRDLRVFWNRFYFSKDIFYYYLLNFVYLFFLKNLRIQFKKITLCEHYNWMKIKYYLLLALFTRNLTDYRNLNKQISYIFHFYKLAGHLILQGKRIRPYNGALSVSTQWMIFWQQTKSS